MHKALAEAKASLPVNVPLHINGKEVRSEKIFDRVNPSNSSEIVGKISMASIENAEQAMQAAQTAYKTWKNVPVEQRATMVDKLADIMTRDKFKLIATQVLEVGKPWAEADGDIGEAIDFLSLLREHMRELQKPLRVGGLPGEVSQYIYKSRGVTAVIAPWNFPLWQFFAEWLQLQLSLETPLL